MKKLSLVLVLLLFVFAANAQETPYQKAMKKEIDKLMKADSLPQLQEAANAFARIAALNPKEWQPYYYQALAYTYQGLTSSLPIDKKDAALVQAAELTKKADAISSNNAEIVTLQGFVIMASLSADPGSRGQTLSAQVLQSFGKALSIDNQNPRALILMAQMEAGMAKFFGSGPEKACGLAKQSVAAFEKQDEEALKAALLPYWGKNLAQGMSKDCQ
ncbi:hypothetical protein [Dyadobacter crusticola]|uniref:hypothetical protein n=1 Tax=Dyadobacter crusticola TaxID=292407 RepID=UPI0004E1148F|nr:hypothetical protein [Dyadobacter crusticola]